MGSKHPKEPNFTFMHGRFLSLQIGIKTIAVAYRLGYCATETHSWAHGDASASAAAMTSLFWNAQAG